MENTDQSSTITVSERQDTLILGISGYFTLETGDELQEKAREAFRRGRLRFVFDFSKCELINSPGVAGMMDLCLRILDDFRGKAVICGLDELKNSVFKMVGILPLVEAAETVDEAIDILNH